MPNPNTGFTPPVTPTATPKITPAQNPLGVIGQRARTAMAPYAAGPGSGGQVFNPAEGPSITPQTMTAAAQGGQQNPPYLQMRTNNPGGAPMGPNAFKAQQGENDQGTTNQDTEPVITKAPSAPGDTVAAATKQPPEPSKQLAKGDDTTGTNGQAKSPTSPNTPQGVDEKWWNESGKTTFSSTFEKEFGRPPTQDDITKYGGIASNGSWDNMGSVLRSLGVKGSPTPPPPQTERPGGVRQPGLPPSGQPNGPPISPPPNSPPQVGGNSLGDMYKFFASDLANKTKQAKSDAVADASSRGVYYGTPLTGSEADIDTQYLRGLGQLQSGMYANEQSNQLARLGLATNLSWQGSQNAPPNPGPMDWSGLGAMLGSNPSEPINGQRSGPAISRPANAPTGKNNPAGKSTNYY